MLASLLCWYRVMREKIFLRVDVVPEDAGGAMGEAAGDHHPAAPGFLQFGQQEGRQRKGAQMIDAEHRLETVLRQGVGHPHDPRVVDQYVEARLAGRLLRGGTNAAEIGLIELQEAEIGLRGLASDRCDGGSRALLGTAPQQHASTMPCEHPG